MANETKVVTGKVRLSYAHLFEPQPGINGGEPRYGVVLLIPKSDKATMKKLRDAQQVALQQGAEKKFGGKIPKAWDDTIHDGDEEADLDRNPEYEGHWYMSVSSKVQPGLVDQQRNPIMDQTELYSGCYARVSINGFAYNANGKKGVSFGLNHVQKWADGESLGGGRTKEEEEFTDIEEDDSNDLI